MSYGIVKIVLDHFGLSRCAGSEVAEHCSVRIGARTVKLVALIFHCLGYGFKAFGGKREITLFNAVALGKGEHRVLYHVKLGGGKQHFNVCGLNTVNNILCRQKVRGRNEHDARFVAGYRKHPILPPAV